MADNKIDIEEIKDWLFEIATGAQILGRDHSYEKQSDLAKRCLELLDDNEVTFNERKMGIQTRKHNTR